MQDLLFNEYPFLLTLLGGFIVGAAAFSLRRASLILDLRIWPLSWLLTGLSTGSFLWSFNWAWGFGEAQPGPARLLVVTLGWISLLGGLTLMFWGLTGLGLRAIFPGSKDRIETRPPYAYLRRPMALGLTIAALGATLIVTTRPAWICFLGWLVLSQALLEIEEWELRSRIPAARGYQDRTPRYFPWRLFQSRKAPRD